jgi:hypothetical protein
LTALSLLGASTTSPDGSQNVAHGYPRIADGCVLPRRVGSLLRTLRDHAGRNGQRAEYLRCPRVMMAASGGNYVPPQSELAAWRRASSMWCRA